jgi:hypothetical protein
VAEKMNRKCPDIRRYENLIRYRIKADVQEILIQFIVEIR